MKKVLILFALVGVFVACNNSTQTTNQDTASCCDSLSCDTVCVDSTKTILVDTTGR